MPATFEPEDDGYAGWKGPGSRDRRSVEPVKPPLRWELIVLNFTEDASPEQVKERYRLLVKMFHPDANAGNRANEDRLSRVIEAYDSYRKNP